MITCPNCGKTSHHPQDVANLYCGNCHAFLGDESIVDADAVGPLVERIKPILRGHPPSLQGAVIADLLSIFVAGHHPAIRERVLQDAVDCARKLIEPNQHLLFPGGLPDGWKS